MALQIARFLLDELVEQGVDRQVDIQADRRAGLRQGDPTRIFRRLAFCERGADVDILFGKIPAVPKVAAHGQGQAQVGHQFRAGDLDWASGRARRAHRGDTAVMARDGAAIELAACFLDVAAGHDRDCAQGIQSQLARRQSGKFLETGSIERHRRGGVLDQALCLTQLLRQQASGRPPFALLKLELQGQRQRQAVGRQLRPVIAAPRAQGRFRFGRGWRGRSA